MKRKMTAAVLAIAVTFSLCACDDWDDYDSYDGYDDSDSDYDSDDSNGYDNNYSDEYGDYSGYSDEDPYFNYEDSYDAYESTVTYGGDYPFDTSIGSAKELSGKIAIVSMFINDRSSSWDFENSEDLETVQTIMNNLKVASEYLEQVSSDYGHNVDFIYDWNEYNELFYNFSVNSDYTVLGQSQDDPYADDSQYSSDYMNFDNIMWDAISNNVPTADVLSKTGAKQVVYMAYYNTPDSNTARSCARNFYDGMEYPYEVCYILIKENGITEPPACFAHEILHTFGAPDLYYAGDYGITQEYVDYVESTRLNDLMRVDYDPDTYQYSYDSITNEITDITAYYIGLTDYSETVNEWGFEKSQHR